VGFDQERICIGPAATVREAMQKIDGNQKGIVLVTDADRHLLGTLTDGDLRRAVLAGRGLDDTVDHLLAAKPEHYARSVSVRMGCEDSELLKLMQERDVRQIPLVDDEGRVVGLATLNDLMPDEVLPLQAVIMAGGFGSRLRPLTDETPKPMLPVAGTPLLQRTIEKLRDSRIRRVNVTTHYQPEKITDYFGDGTSFGVDIKYVAEDQPLGTAGAISLMGACDEPLLVINGDILTSVDFGALLEYHRQHHADLTVCVRQYDLRIPYGVVETEGGLIRGLREKPTLSLFVNAGIYLLEPSVRAFLPSGQRFDMTDLVEVLLARGRPVASFPITEYWLDIGQVEDYEQAQRDVLAGRLSR
jgi:dTDP-glucose pyrophosphorylase